MSILDSLRAKYDDAVGRWRLARADLDAAENSLYTVRDEAMKDPASAAEWQSKFNKVNALQSTIIAVEDTIATVSGWISSASHAVGLSGLGILPAVPWAAVTAIVGGAAALAAVVYEVNQFVYAMNMRAWNNENIRRSQAGEDPLPAETAPTPASSSGGGLFDGATELVKWGLGAYLVWQVLEHLQRSRSARAA